MLRAMMLDCFDRDVPNYFREQELRAKQAADDKLMAEISSREDEEEAAAAGADAAREEKLYGADAAAGGCAPSARK